MIRGYEDVKLANVERFHQQVQALLAPAAQPVALTAKPSR